MPRANRQSLFETTKADRQPQRRASGWLRVSLEWIAVALVLAAGAAILLLYFD